MGGTDGTNYLKDVQYAPLNSDGTVGTWSYTTEMTSAKGYIVPAILNGFLYVYGGYDGTNSFNTVDYATLNTNGTIGSWLASTAFATGRYGHQVVINNGITYLTGGYGGSGYQSNTQYSVIQSQSRTSTYSKVFDLGALYSLSGISYGGVLPGGNGSISYRTAGTNGSFGNLSRADSIASGGSVCGIGDVRYVFVLATIDDSLRATQADENYSESYISHIAVNYSQNHAPTERRLAHGKYFSDEEVLQPLDTCSS